MCFKTINRMLPYRRRVQSIIGGEELTARKYGDLVEGIPSNDCLHYDFVVRIITGRRWAHCSVSS